MPNTTGYENYDTPVLEYTKWQIEQALRESDNSDLWREWAKVNDELKSREEPKNMFLADYKSKEGDMRESKRFNKSRFHSTSASWNKAMKRKRGKIRRRQDSEAVSRQAGG